MKRCIGRSLGGHWMWSSLPLGHVTSPVLIYNHNQEALSQSFLGVSLPRHDRLTLWPHDWPQSPAFLLYLIAGRLILSNSKPHLKSHGWCLWPGQPQSWLIIFNLNSGIFQWIIKTPLSLKNKCQGFKGHFLGTRDKSFKLIQCDDLMHTYTAKRLP